MCALFREGNTVFFGVSSRIHSAADKRVVLERMLLCACTNERTNNRRDNTALFIYSCTKRARVCVYVSVTNVSLLLLFAIESGREREREREVRERERRGMGGGERPTRVCRSSLVGLHVFFPSPSYYSIYGPALPSLLPRFFFFPQTS